MTRLEDIKAYFKDYNFTDTRIRLNACSEVLDLKKFVETNIAILESNSGNKRYIPYFERLKRVYEICKATEKL